MSFDTEINQLMAQIDVLKKENELLRASPPSQELIEPVAWVVERFSLGMHEPKEFFENFEKAIENSCFGFNKTKIKPLFTHAADSAQATIALEAECEKLEAEKAELLEALKECAEDMQSWAEYASPYFQEKHKLIDAVRKYNDVIARMESK